MRSPALWDQRVHHTLFKGKQGNLITVPLYTILSYPRMAPALWDREVQPLWGRQGTPPPQDCSQPSVQGATEMECRERCNFQKRKLSIKGDGNHIVVITCMWEMTADVFTPRARDVCMQNHKLRDFLGLIFSWQLWTCQIHIEIWIWHIEVLNGYGGM